MPCIMSCVPPTPTYELIDRILGGTLGQKLDAWRAEGLSYERIAARLSAEHDIDVAGTTVYRWLNPAAPEPAA